MSKDYEVLKITELTKVGDLHEIEKYYRHQIKTKGGTVISVNVDEADFTPEKASPILTKAAVNADAVLKG
jgi:ABC-type branched-subunit amino acid transport system substrate-binding protein|tara:strand:- start:7378 stop:7587 length:210 start_codon:yes stop_codon:yes gene_type:complete